MKLGSKNKRVLTLLSQVADKDAGATISIDGIAKRLKIERENAKEICNTLHVYELIEGCRDRHFKITAAGMEQLKPWWRRHIVLIVAVATFIVAAVAALFTILVYLRGCE